MRRVRSIPPIAVLLALLVTVPAAGFAATDAEIGSFIEKLGSQDAKVRAEAFENAAAIGPQAIPALKPLLGSSDKAVAGAALIALEKIVGPTTRRGTETDRRTASAALCKLAKSDLPVGARHRVLRCLALAGKDEAVPTLADLLRDRDVREMARWALERIPGDAAGKAIVDALDYADGEFRAALIKTIGIKRYAAANFALIMEANSDDPNIRMEAIDALGRIGLRPSERTVFNAMKTESERDRRRAINDYLRLAEAQLDSPQAAAKMYERLLRLSTTEWQKCAALVGLGRAGLTDSIQTALPYLGDESKQVRGSATACLASIPGNDADRALADAMRGANPMVRSGLVRVLAARGDPQSVPAIRKSLKDRSAEVRVAALDVLGQLDDPSFESTLLEAAQKGSDETRPIALRSYIQLADARLKKDEKNVALEMYETAVDLADGNDERRSALAGIAAIASPESLPKVEPYISSGASKSAALTAYIAIGDGLAKSGDRQRAIEVLEKAIDAGPRRALALQAARLLYDLGVTVDLAVQSGFLTTWHLIGPFPCPNRDDWDTPYIPEQEIDLAGTYEVAGKTFKWKKYSTGDPQGIFDLGAILSPNNRVAVYAHATVDSDTAQDVLFKIGSDDGIICWLNGKQIHNNKADRGVEIDQDVVETRLESGTNTILLKILQGGGDWGFCMRITTPRNRPLRFDK